MSKTEAIMNLSSHMMKILSIAEQKVTESEEVLANESLQRKIRIRYQYMADQIKGILDREHQP